LLNEEGVSQNKPLETVAGNYIKGKFFFDFL